MKQPIYIFGAGGLGREVKAMLRAMPEWDVVGFYDDNKPVGSLVDDTPCLGGLTALASDQTQKNLILAVGDPTIKTQILTKIAGAKHLSFPVVIHPLATLLDPDNIALGAGCIVTAGCVLTTGISIHDHVLLNLNVSVGHDTRIGEACSVMPGVNIAGNVMLGKGVLVGSGVNIVNNIHVGDFSRIGAGAVVIRDVNDGATVVGVPAKEKHSS